MNKIDELEAELINRPKHWTVGVSQTDLRKLLAVVRAAQKCEGFCKNTGMGKELSETLAALEASRDD